MRARLVQMARFVTATRLDPASSKNFTALMKLTTSAPIQQSSTISAITSPDIRCTSPLFRAVQKRNNNGMRASV